MVLKWDGDRAAKAIKEATAKGSLITAEAILTEAGENVPRQTGTLARSGTISINQDINAQEAYSQAKTGAVKRATNANESTSKIFISYNTPYAHRQHEDLNMSHDGNGSYYTSGGKKEYVKSGSSKFLEKGWNAKIKSITKNIKAEVKKQGIE